MVDRVTYRRRKSFRTASNVVRKVKTPGGKLVLHYMGKKGKGPQCGEAACERRLHGVPVLRPKEYSRISKRQKKVSRAYGGSRCGVCVRKRIVRAFLIEEQKIVKKVPGAAVGARAVSPARGALRTVRQCVGRGGAEQCAEPLPRLPTVTSPLPHPTPTPPCGLRAC